MAAAALKLQLIRIYEVLSAIGRQPKAVSCLLKAERLASERYERLRGYPGDVQEVALALKTEATEAVRDYRA
jgi:hypothetical protein